MKINSEIFSLDVNTILERINTFVNEKIELNYPFKIYPQYVSMAETTNFFIKFYNYKSGCFGNLVYDTEHLSEEKKEKLILQKKLDLKRGLNSGIFLKKEDLVYLLNDILFINEIYNIDPVKVILDKDNYIKKEKVVEEEEITEIKRIDLSNSEYKNYFLNRGINLDKNENKKDYFRKSFVEHNFKLLTTKNKLNNTIKEYLAIKCIYKNSFDGYLLPKYEKAKIGFNSPTLYIKDSDKISIFEGKMDVLTVANYDSDIFLNNGINYNKYLFSTLEKNYKEKNFYLDKDMPGIIFFLETIGNLYKEDKKIEEIFYTLNKKLLLILDEFTKTEIFKNFYDNYRNIKKENPIKRKKNPFFQIFEKIKNNEYFDKFNTNLKFKINLNDNKILDTYNLILLFNDIFELNKDELFPEKILSEELSKIKELDKSINFYFPNKFMKDFNDEFRRKMKIIDRHITDKEEENYNFVIEPKISENEKIRLYNLRNNDINDYKKEIINIIDNSFINYFETYKFKVNFNKIEERFLNLDLEESNFEIENNENYNNIIYGIDETGIGKVLGSIFVTMTYANKNYINDFLIENINNNLQYREYLNELNNNKLFLLDKDIVENKNCELNRIKTLLKNFNEDEKENLKPLFDYYYYLSITDSKKLNDDMINNIYNLLKELEKNLLLNIRTEKTFIKNIEKVKTEQKKSFIDLINSIPEMNEESREIYQYKKDTLENESKNYKLSRKDKIKLKLLTDVLIKDKKIIIDGENILYNKNLRKDINIIFEPKADFNYFEVSLSSIISRTEELIENNEIVKNIYDFSNNEKNEKNKEILINLANNIKNSKGYWTENHKNCFLEVLSLKNLNKNCINYLKSIYRNTKVTKDLFDINNDENNIER